VNNHKGSTEAAFYEAFDDPFPVFEGFASFDDVAAEDAFGAIAEDAYGGVDSEGVEAVLVPDFGVFSVVVDGKEVDRERAGIEEIEFFLEVVDDGVKFGRGDPKLELAEGVFGCIKGAGAGDQIDQELAFLFGVGAFVRAWEDTRAEGSRAGSGYLDGERHGAGFELSFIEAIGFVIRGLVEECPSFATGKIGQKDAQELVEGTLGESPLDEGRKLLLKLALAVDWCILVHVSSFPRRRVEFWCRRRTFLLATGYSDFFERSGSTLSRLIACE